MNEKQVCIKHVDSNLESGVGVVLDTSQEVDFLNPGKIVPSLQAQDICLAFIITITAGEPPVTKSVAVLKGK